MRNQLVFFALFLGASLIYSEALAPVGGEAVKTYHHCSYIGGKGNDPHLFDTSDIYKCDEGSVEISGTRDETIENGYVYTTELGNPDGFEEPHRVTPSDLSDNKWCHAPGPSDPNRMVRCGNKPITCWDGKRATWDPEWQGYSCVTPDHDGKTK